MFISFIFSPSLLIHLQYRYHFDFFTFRFSYSIWSTRTFVVERKVSSSAGHAGPVNSLGAKAKSVRRLFKLPSTRY